MRRWVAVLTAVVCLILSGCTLFGLSDDGGEIEQNATGSPDVGGNFHSDPIYGVFRNTETGEAEVKVIGQLNHYGDAMLEDYAESLSWYTELNFAVKITDDELGTAVDWLPDATLFDTEAVTAVLYNDDGEKVTHHFEDNNALRWFMLDSLAETLRLPAYDLHYTMDGGNDLVLEGLTPVDTFPAGEMYWSAHGIGNG